MQLIIDTANTKISIKNKLFFIENLTTQRQISPKRISSIAITTNCTLNASAIKMAAQQQIPIYFFNNFGTIQAKMWSPYFTNLASLRRNQLLFYNTTFATQWVLSIIQRKTNLQIQTLTRFSKDKTKVKPLILEQVTLMSKQLKNLDQYNDVLIDNCRNNIMGIEGNCSKCYFKAIALLLPQEYTFTHRNRRPATDFFNAALNYLYGMTYSIVEGGVFAKGLDPFIGYLHTENYKKTALVFDLIEPIRPLIDRLLLDLCINKQLKEEHFRVKEQGYWLSKQGKKLIIPTFNDYLFKRIHVEGEVKRLKDLIYAESKQLATFIESVIN